MQGITADRKRVNVKVTDAGEVYITGGTGGGGSTAPVVVTLLNAVTATGTGNVTIGSGKTLTVEIHGTATAASVTFQGTLSSGTASLIMGSRKADLEIGTSGGLNEIWTFDVTGLETFVANLTSVTGGNVTVKGKLV
jgi:hypothetical protein